MKKEGILGGLFNLGEVISRFALFSSQNSAGNDDDIAPALKNNEFNNGNSITKKTNNNKIKNKSALGQLLNLKSIAALFVSLLILAAPVFTIKQLVSLQGKVNFNGVLVDNGDLTRVLKNE